MKISKLAIGTAHFGLDYGVKKDGVVDIKEIKKILSFAKKNGINTLDTSYTYKKAETKLGIVGVKDWKITSKIPPITKSKVDLKIRSSSSIIPHSCNPLIVYAIV